MERNTLLRHTFALASIFVLAAASTSDPLSDDCACCQDSTTEPSPDWINYGGIFLILITVVAMFWALALVCEEFFVPALNVMCDEWKIPDDIAGATFMAAGASSPELFTSFIGLIVYNSNIGVGTVVGSEIFNHMIISAGSVLFAKNGVLFLDKRIICRDLFFYTFSLLVLIYSLKNKVFLALPETFNENNSWDSCLSVTTLHGIALVVVYIIYAIVCGNFAALIDRYCPRENEDDVKEDINEEAGTPDRASGSNIRASFSPLVAPVVPKSFFHDGTMKGWETDDTRMSFQHPEALGATYVPHADLDKTGHTRPSDLVHQLNNKPVYAKAGRGGSRPSSSAGGGSIAGVEMETITEGVANPMNNNGEKAAPASIMDDSETQWIGQKEDLKNARFRGSPVALTTTETSIPTHLEPSYWQNLWLFIADNETPKDIGALQLGEGVCKCYAAVFQDCIGLDAVPPWMTWQRRYFTMDHHGLHSTPNPDDHATGTHVQIIDLSTATSITVNDRHALLFYISFDNEVLTRIQFRAYTTECMDAMVKLITIRIEEHRKDSETEKNCFAEAVQEDLWAEGDDHHEHDLCERPKGRYAIWWHFIVFPLKWLFANSLVDCRIPENRDLYGRMIAICVFFLASLSYIMILCCDYIGDYIGASPTVMGLTLSAVGTSFPNLWSSMVVARQGYGNMAICNALGSNIFNVNVALGLPWVVFLLIRNGKPYDEMKDHGIVMFVVLLEAVSVIWFALIYVDGFKMKAWMAPWFILIYFIVLITAVALS